MSLGIYVENKEIFTFLKWIDRSMPDLFAPNELLHLRGRDANIYNQIWDDISYTPYKDIKYLQIYVGKAPANVIKDRLDVLGYGEIRVKGIFEELLEDRIDSYTTFLQDTSHQNYEILKGHYEESLQKLQNLTITYGWIN